MRISPPLAVPVTGRFVSALLVLSLAPLTGCESDTYRYHYAGNLAAPDGGPAADVKVYVTDDDGGGMFRTDRERWGYWTAWGTETDQAGRFSGEFNGDGTYTRWFDAFPVPPPAKQLGGVYVVVNRQGEWVPTFVPVSENAQKQAYPGGRRITLPAVRLATPASKP